MFTSFKVVIKFNNLTSLYLFVLCKLNFIEFLKEEIIQTTTLLIILLHFVNSIVSSEVELDIFERIVVFCFNIRHDL
jgi:hypothetical protein